MKKVVEEWRGVEKGWRWGGDGMEMGGEGWRKDGEGMEMGEERWRREGLEEGAVQRVPKRTDSFFFIRLRVSIPGPLSFIK